MATAQETFKAMIRTQVAPSLREMGFVGSGQQFALPSQTHWALLGFQKSALWSNQHGVRFTVNLTVAHRERWDAYVALNPKFSAKPGADWDISPVTQEFFGDRYWHSRIGMLIPRKPRRLDHWWRVDADAETSSLATEVTDTIREYGIPALTTHVK